MAKRVDIDVGEIIGRASASFASLCDVFMTTSQPSSSNDSVVMARMRNENNAFQEIIECLKCCVVPSLLSFQNQKMLGGIPTENVETNSRKDEEDILSGIHFSKEGDKEKLHEAIRFLRENGPSKTSGLRSACGFDIDGEKYSSVKNQWFDFRGKYFEMVGIVNLNNKKTNPLYGFSDQKKRPKK